MPVAAVAGYSSAPVAAESGESITETIIHALEERLWGRRTVPDVTQEIPAISKRCGSLSDKDPRNPDEIPGHDDGGAPR